MNPGLRLTIVRPGCCFAWMRVYALRAALEIWGDEGRGVEMLTWMRV